MREETDQFTLIRSTEIYCANNPLFNSSFHIVIQVIYTLKLLQAAVIVQWSQQVQKSLDNIDNQDADDIYDLITPTLRAKLLKDVTI